jgi:hypothetical protein
LNKQLTLESDYIHSIIKIVVGWKVLVCKEEKKKKKRGRSFLPSHLSFNSTIG